VKKYAYPEINEWKIKRLMEMGFSREKALAALVQHGYD
jgi:hypothetical protein